MKVTRIRKFKRSGISEITLRVSKKESEQICHAVNCMNHTETSGYPDLQRAGLELLESLTEPPPNAGVFWTTWGV